jgi:hypothetical protein
MNLANINRYGTYAIVILLGMAVAAMAAYYVLVEFIYPAKTSESTPVESFTETSAAVPKEESINQNPPLKFVGELDEVQTDCLADGECSVMVDGRKVMALAGWNTEEVGQVQGMSGFADLEAHKGQLVEVYAKDLGDQQFTLYGDKDFYIKLVDY